MPRFSVVIPAYNCASLVGETIRSVLAQTERDLELIVVDDGSTDATPDAVAAIASDDPRVSIVRQHNQGTAAARNTGIAKSSARYVSFVDNDDLWMPRYLESMGRALDAHPDAGFAYCDAWQLDDANMRLSKRTGLQIRVGPAIGASLEQQFVALARANFVLSSVTARRAVLDDVGGFATDVLGTDDYDLWFRLLLAGHGAIQASSTPLLLQRDRFDSQSKDALTMNRGLRLVLERVLADARTPVAVKKVVTERLRGVDREIALSSGSNVFTRLARALRSRLISIRLRLLDKRRWHDPPPPEVLAAFPQLAASDHSRR